MADNAKTRAVRAVQMAMDLDVSVARALRVEAARADLTPQDHMRKLLGLSYRPAQRPRLSLSLSDEDYALLAEHFGLDPADRPAIKKAVITALSDAVPSTDTP